MSVMLDKVRNNPTLFAKASEICERLSSITIVNHNPESNIIQPKKNEKFRYSGDGGIPLFFDKHTGKIYMDQSDRHSIIIGPTASKKSRLVAIPSVRLMGKAGESMIISDPKAEIYQRTAAYLKNQGYQVYVLNLRHPNEGSGWNPLMLPYMFYKQGDIDRAYEFANDIAINLTNIDKSQKEAFWDNSAGSLLFGLIISLFKFCKDNGVSDEYVNISNVLVLRNTLCSGSSMAIRGNALWRYLRADSFIESALIGTLETAEETRAGILSVFDQKMRAFSIQPTLLDMLAVNDINYQELINVPTAIFLILPDEKTAFHGLVSLFIKQSYEYLIFQIQEMIENNETNGLRINYILDEFSSLPTITDFPAMITAARSRNIRFNLFLQSKHQLKLRYGEETDTIMSNCENWIFLTSRELDFLKEISDLCGGIRGREHIPVLSVSDLQRLDKETGEALVLSARFRPFISNLADISLYDNDDYLIDRLSIENRKKAVSISEKLQQSISWWKKKQFEKASDAKSDIEKGSIFLKQSEQSIDNGDIFESLKSIIEASGTINESVTDDTSE